MFEVTKSLNNDGSITLKLNSFPEIGSATAFTERKAASRLAYRLYDFIKMNPLDKRVRIAEDTLLRMGLEILEYEILRNVN